MSPIPRALAALLRFVVLSAVALGTPLVEVGRACGPWFADSLFQTAFAALRSPLSSIELELERIDLDIDLPGGLVVPERNPSSGPWKKFERQKSREDKELLASLSSAALLDNEEECRDELLSSPSELTRDVAELAAILAKRSEGGNAFDRLADETLLADYERIRRVMFRLEKDPAVATLVAERRWPAGLPAEFVDYLDGAAAYREEKYEEAIRHFETLLARPLEERLHRSTIAAYMIGRCRLAQGDPGMNRSLQHFEEVLRLREEGCHDVFGVGWDALKCVADHSFKFDADPELAIRYYLAHARAGNSHSLACLRSTVEAMDYDRAAADPVARRVRTALLLGEPGGGAYWEYNAEGANENQDAWLEAMEQAEVHDEEASRLAYLAYQAGRFDQAGRWLDRARRLDETGNWVRAKLELQQGGVSAARRALDRALPAFEVSLEEGLQQPETNQTLRVNLPRLRSYQASQYWGDQGLVRLADDDFTGALDAFLRGGYWFEAAYVAEQLLSRDELLRWVLDHCPPDPYFVERQERTLHARLRYLTARRLARDHYFKNARDLLPPELLPAFDRYVAGYRMLFDEGASESDRIEKGWETAQIHRSLGMELFGTELGPDWFSLGRGNFSWASFTRRRMGYTTAGRFDSGWDDHFRNPLAEAGLDEKTGEGWYFEEPNEGQLAATPAERWRHRHYAGLPHVMRFHYRAVAADLAWEVARLMPQEDAEAARILAIAGRWIAQRDPEPADFFYKQLVLRNRSTALGNEADLRRWFPPVDWEFDPWELTGSEKPEHWGWW